MTKANKNKIIEILASKLYQYFKEDAEWIFGVINRNTVEDGSINSVIEDFDEETKDIYLQRAGELFEIIFYKMSHDV